MKKMNNNTSRQISTTNDMYNKKRISQVIGCSRNIVPGELKPTRISYNHDMAGMASKTFRGLKRISVMGRYMVLRKFMNCFEDYIIARPEIAEEIQSTEQWWRIEPESDNTSFPEGRPDPGMVFRTIKLRLYPNKTQTNEINQLVDNCLEVYNQLLWLKRKFYNKHKINLGWDALMHYFQNILAKDPDFSWIVGSYTEVLKQTIGQVCNAYDRFFRFGGEYPKYKRKTDECIAYFPNGIFPVSNSFEDSKVTITEDLKDIKFRCSPEYYERLKTYHQKVRSAKFSRDFVGKFYLSILIEMPREVMVMPEITKQHKENGRDVKNSVRTDKVQEEHNKSLIDKQQKKILKLQKHLSRKEEGSRNCNKLQKKLAKAYNKLKNQKDDFGKQFSNKSV